VGDPQAFDVIIAGGGMAGGSVAAALDRLGLRTLVVEPGLDSSKRLAGELIHPPGAANLAELGLLGSLEAAGGAPVLGFAVVGDGQSYRLPYASLGTLRLTGFAMEHAVIASTLRAAVARLPHVTVWDGARVVAVRLGAPEAVSVTISRRGDYTQLNARLVVAADGAASSTRRLAGIGCRRRRLSSMLGFVLPGGRLPHPGFGTVFIDGPAPALAYHIGPDSVRVMFNVPDNPHGVDAATRDLAYLAALPPLLCEDVRQAMDARRGLASASYSVVPDAVTRHRVVLVGDAAGCCHPLTATGLSVCTRDAVRLRDALRASGGDVPAALRHYAAQRAGPQRTRMALAEALYAVFVARTPEARLLRQGLLRYWESSPRGRAASMTLLSTEEGRMSVMAREYAWVVRYTLAGLLTRPEPRPLGVRTRAAFGLSLATLRYAGEMLRGLRA
jgi:squalene monooxygenase